MVWNFEWPFTSRKRAPYSGVGVRVSVSVSVDVSVGVDVSVSVGVGVSVSVGVKLILTKKTIFLAFKHAFGPWSETLNGRLPPKTSSYSAQTSAKCISEHSRHFIFDKLLQQNKIKINNKKNTFLAFKHAFGPWSKTLNGRLPPKTSSYSARTSAKCVLEHSRHFIFWRNNFFFRENNFKIFEF